MGIPVSLFIKTVKRFSIASQRVNPAGIIGRDDHSLSLGRILLRQRHAGVVPFSPMTQLIRGYRVLLLYPGG